MHPETSGWPSWIFPWRSGAHRETVHQAREAVAHLKPAVVVTGGSRGIGLSLARRFIEGGHRTVIVARSAPELAKAVASLKDSTGFEATSVLCDVTEANAADIIKARLTEAGLYLDVLVNNAGVGLAGSFVMHDPRELSRLIALNIEAVARLTREALPDMLARRRGGILNIASLGGVVPGPNQAAYYASKSFVWSLTEAIASEVAGQGVRVSVALPGPVDTVFHRKMGAETSLYRFVFPSMGPDRVARSVYRGFMFGQRVIVPGIFSKLAYVALRVLPHLVTVPIVYWLLRRPEKAPER